MPASSARIRSADEGDEGCTPSSLRAASPSCCHHRRRRSPTRYRQQRRTNRDRHVMSVHNPHTRGGSTLRGGSPANSDGSTQPFDLVQDPIGMRNLAGNSPHGSCHRTCVNVSVTCEMVGSVRDRPESGSTAASTVSKRQGSCAGQSGSFSSAALSLQRAAAMTAEPTAPKRSAWDWRLSPRLTTQQPCPRGLVRRANVTQRPGIVRRIVVDGDRFTLDDEVVLDVTATVGEVGLEGGLLGIVFVPDGSRVYMGMTSGNDVGGGRRQLVEYHDDRRRHRWGLGAPDPRSTGRGIRAHGRWAGIRPRWLPLCRPR